MFFLKRTACFKPSSTETDDSLLTFSYLRKSPAKVLWLLLQTKLLQVYFQYSHVFVGNRWFRIFTPHPCSIDGWVRVLRPFNSISVISRRWKGEHERLCAMKRRLGSGRISPPAGFEPATPWSEVGSANRSAMRTLHLSQWLFLK